MTFFVSPHLWLNLSMRRSFKPLVTRPADFDVFWASTRRQLLEYAHAYDAEGVLLVDMESERVRRIRFPPMRAAAPGAGRRRWSSALAAAAIGAALAAAAIAALRWLP